MHGYLDQPRLLDHIGSAILGVRHQPTKESNPGSIATVLAYVVKQLQAGAARRFRQCAPQPAF